MKPAVKHSSDIASPSLWRNRDYLLLWGGQVVSLTGTGITQTAFPLLVWDLSHSAVQVGLVGGLGTLPYLFLSLPVGALIDRWNRKRTMILCDIGRGLNLGSVLLALVLGHLLIAQLYINALIEGSLFVFFNLAEVACLPHVVGAKQLPVAIAQNEVTQGITALLSPLLGGALYSLRQALPFLADALSYGVSVFSLLLIRTEFQQERQRATRPRLLFEIKEGLVWLWQNPLIRYMAFLTGGLNFTSAGLIPILLVLVKQAHGSSILYGVILTIGGVGGIVGALIASPIQKRFRFGSIIISKLWIGAFLWPLYAVTPQPILLGVISAVIFLTGPIYNVVSISYRLALIPDALQGRVNSVFRRLAFGFQPLGWILTGVLIQTFDVVSTVLILGVCQLVLAVATAFNSHVRGARPLSEMQIEGDKKD